MVDSIGEILIKYDVKDRDSILKEIYENFIIKKKPKRLCVECFHNYYKGFLEYGCNMGYRVYDDLRADNCEDYFNVDLLI